jgi:hypothetical protein
MRALTTFPPSLPSGEGNTAITHEIGNRKLAIGNGRAIIELTARNVLAFCDIWVVIVALYSLMSPPVYPEL